MADHTEEPWTIEYDGPSLPIITAPSHPQIIALLRGENAETHALLIVKAVNNHDALLKAVKALVTVEGVPEEDGITMLANRFGVPRRIIVQAQDAIAKAERRQT